MISTKIGQICGDLTVVELLLEVQQLCVLLVHSPEFRVRHLELEGMYQSTDTFQWLQQLVEYHRDHATYVHQTRHEVYLEKWKICWCFCRERCSGYKHDSTAFFRDSHSFI